MIDSYFGLVFAVGLSVGFFGLLLVMPIVNKFDVELLVLVPVLLAGVLMFVMVFYPDPFTPDCPACGASYYDEPYCSSCGADLVDDCACGRVWKKDDVFCSVCGAER